MERNTFFEVFLPECEAKLRMDGKTEIDEEFTIKYFSETLENFTVAYLCDNENDDDDDDDEYDDDDTLYRIEASNENIDGDDLLIIHHLNRYYVYDDDSKYFLENEIDMPDKYISSCHTSYSFLPYDIEEVEINDKGIEFLKQFQDSGHKIRIIELPPKPRKKGK